MKRFHITVNGNVYDVQVEEADADAAGAEVSVPAAPVSQPSSSGPSVAAGTAIESPMPGTIVSVAVTAGDRVKVGDVLVVLEAMKMENEIKAPNDGTVTAVHVRKGDSVESGTPLVSLQ